MGIFSFQTRKAQADWDKLVIPSDTENRPHQRLHWQKSVPLFKTYGEGNSTPLQYSCLENPLDGGTWWAAVHGVAKSRTWLSDFTFTFHFHALEKEMVTHSSVLAWRIPGTGEPGGLPSVGSPRVGHDWSNLAAAAAAASRPKDAGWSPSYSCCIYQTDPCKIQENPDRW